MKFYCDACNTKYAISDDKVRGKILKVRCKNCGNVITVREARAPVRGAAASGGTADSAPSNDVRSVSDSGVPTSNWYFAVNGQTEGPFTLDGLRRKYASGNIGDETYVWHEKLTEWKPVATVEAFADALARGQRLSPRRKTIGFSGQLEAIQAASGPSKVREGAVPQAAKSAEPAQKSQPAARRAAAPAPGDSRSSTPAGGGAQPGSSGQQPKLRTPSRPAAQAQAPTPESRPLKDARKEKLERLRARLGGSFGKSDEEEKEKPKAQKPKQQARPSPREAQERPPQASSDAAGSAELSADQLPTLDEGALPQPVAGGAVLTFADGLSDEEAAAKTAEDSQPPGDAVDFDLPPRAQPGKRSPSSTSDILEQVIGPVDEPAQDPSAVDSGVIPFFDDSPKLDGDATREVTGGRSEVTSGSLLIDLQNIKKEGRGKRVAAVAGLVLVVVAIGGAAAYMYLNRPEPEPVAQDTNTNVPKQKDELVIKTYSNDEQAKLATMELEEEFLFSEDEAVAADQVAAAEAQADREEKAAAKGKKPSKGAATARRKARPKAVEKERKEQTPTAVVKAQEQPSLAARTEEPADEPKSLREALLRQRRELAVERPKDKLREQIENKTGLSKDEARRGFRRVKDSVRVCRERHNRRAAAMDEKKIKLSVKVQPNGRVSSFNASPASVRNSEFERCMQSHKGRWRFAEFNGDPVVINTSIILQ